MYVQERERTALLKSRSWMECMARFSTIYKTIFRRRFQSDDDEDDVRVPAFIHATSGLVLAVLRRRQDLPLVRLHILT
jgi:hypothetical protein